MNKRVVCCECGVEHWETQGWKHELLQNGCYRCTGRPPKLEEKAPEPQERLEEVPEVSPKKQRWSREAYNAYQREYMRKRRERS